MATNFKRTPRLVYKKLLMLFVFSLAFSLPTILFSQDRVGKHNYSSSRSGIQLSNLKQIARLTGTPLKGEVLPSPNNTAENYDVGGTDLGIIWEMDSAHVGIFFGDTNGKDFVPSAKGGGNGSNWRSNVLAFSNDVDLDDGLTITGMFLDTPGKAGEVCAGAKANPTVYQTSIPTAAIRAGGVDYVHYMNIYEWAGQNGRWLTNFSSLYTSHDNGATWQRKEQVTFKPDSKFSQVSYAKKDGFVYMVGTLAGRGSPTYLARIREGDMLQMDAYEYWNGDAKKWVKSNEEAAIAIIPGPVGETSLLYHKTYKKWIIAYSYDAAYEPILKKKLHALVYRDAEELNGNWSDLKILTTEKEYRRVLGLTLGTGFGSAFSVNGIAEDAALWKSKFREGIIEDYLSARWFLKRYQELSGIYVSGIKEMLEGTALHLTQVFAEFGENLSHFLVPTIKIFNAEAVVFGRNISNASMYFLPRLQKIVNDNQMNITLLQARLHEDAALIGGASRWKEIDSKVALERV